MTAFGDTALIRRLQRLGFSLEDAALISVGTAPSGGGSSSPWEKTLDLPLDTLAGWSVQDGTYDVDGGVLHTPQSGGQSLIWFAEHVPEGLCVLEVELKVTTGGDFNSRAGLVLNNDGTNRSNDQTTCYLQGNGPLIQVNLDEAAQSSQGTLPLITDVGYGVWTTLRLAKVGKWVSAYVDGAYLGDMMDESMSLGAQVLRFGLTNYLSDASYRNLKMWQLVTP